MRFKIIFYLFVFLLIFAGLNGCTEKKVEQKKIAFGPYLQNMGDDKVTICWTTQDGMTTLKNTQGKIDTVNNYRMHKTIIARLQGNTTYNYDILNDGSDEGKGTFTTFPEKAQPFRFCVLGDTRSNHDIHQRIVNNIINEKPLFVINTGDLVGNGNVMSDWEHFFKINKELIRNVPYFSVLGNHEKDSENYYNFFSLPGNERYYFYSVGNALFVILDMEGPNYDAPGYLHGEARDKFWNEIGKDYLVKEKKWLENVLTLNNGADFIFVFFHPTFYSIKKSRVAEAKERRKFWGDIFERHHVQAVFNGHDHYYHHAEHGGTHYIVTAGGGAGLYSTDAPQPETVFYKKINHYMTVDVGMEKSEIRAIDIDGNLMEKIIVDKIKQ
jgi:hypothetical protein